MVNKSKVLIINCRRNGLGVIRSLKNHYIIAADHLITPAFYSKYVNEKHILPDRIKNEEGFINGLIKIASKYDDKLFLIPTNDDYLEIFIRNKEILEKYFIFVFESDSLILESCVDKQKVYETLKVTSVTFPKHYSKLDLVCDTINYPVIIKPGNKSNSNIIGKQGLFRIRVCENSIELKEAVEILENLSSNYVIQELIKGDDSQLYACGVFSYRGDLKACFTGRKLRQFPPSTGEGSYCESVESPELIKLSNEIVKKLNYTGIANIEFKYKDGMFYFIEMNPRSWSFNSISSYCGVNLPEIALDYFKGVDQKNIITNSRKGTWIFLYEDFLHNVIINQNVNLFKFLKQSFKANVHAYYDLKDLRPVIRFYFFDFWNLFKNFTKLLYLKCFN
jgi:D-aspartate ligase